MPRKLYDKTRSEGYDKTTLTITDKMTAISLPRHFTMKIARSLAAGSAVLPNTTKTQRGSPSRFMAPILPMSLKIHRQHKRGFSTTSINKEAPKLQSPAETDIDAFRELLNHQLGSVLVDPDDIEPYNTDWTKHYQGSSSIVLRPQSTHEVSAILRYCHQHHIGVVPQAGNTGLVGGSVPLAKTTEATTNNNNPQEVVLSVERMNEILGWNPTTGILTGQAGGIIQDWQEYARDNCNAILPIDLGSKGSCCIGGTVSTNAGGQYYARYKSLHANVVGLEVVVANGDIMQFNLKEGVAENNNNTNVLCNLKDNTGYDLKHLFIGAEGSLGVITKVALWCSSAYPSSRKAVLCACTSLDQVQDCLQLARQVLGETLSAFEFMDRSVTSLVAANNLRNGSSTSSNMIPKQSSTSTNDGSGGDDTFYPYYILVETHGSNATHDEEKMQTFLESSLEQEVVVDGVVAQDLAQVEALWAVREGCNPTVASLGYTYKYDVSLPMSEFETFANDMNQRLDLLCGSNTEIVTTNWGHIMDGNLHFNVTTPGQFEMVPEVLDTLEPYIFESVIQRGGSISAEHGLGQSKHKYLPMVHDPVTLSLMRSIKQLIDPHGILNPGKYLPPSSQ